MYKYFKYEFCFPLFIWSNRPNWCIQVHGVRTGVQQLHCHVPPCFLGLPPYEAIYGKSLSDIQWYMATDQNKDKTAKLSVISQQYYLALSNTHHQRWTMIITHDSLFIFNSTPYWFRHWLFNTYVSRLRHILALQCQKASEGGGAKSFPQPGSW